MEGDSCRTIRRRYKAWTTAEQKRLAKMVADGASTKAIAKMLGRGPKGIDTRIYDLGLVRPKRKDNTSVSVYMPPSLRDKVEIIAGARGTNMSDTLRFLIGVAVGDVRPNG